MIVAVAAAGLCSGCGSAASHTPSGAELTLQRNQLILISRGLRAAQKPVREEVAAARRVWPQLAGGLPRTFPQPLRNAVRDARTHAKALPEPSFMTQTSKLTGPAAGLAGLYESYSRLSERGWSLTASTIAAITTGTPAVVRYERNNSPLYIDIIYDGHFQLSLVGKSLESAYTKLGGPSAFGGQLTQSEVDTLARAYSIPSVRLEPHPAPGVEVG